MSSLGENPELVFESQVACAGAGKAAVPSVAKVTSPRAIHDLFERGLTAIEVVVDWLTVVLAVEGAFIASQLLRAGGISRPAFNVAPYVPFAVATLVVLLLDRDGAYRAGNSLLRIKETERSLRVSVQAFALILPIAFLVGGAVPRAIFVVAMAGVPSLQILEKQLFFLGVRALRERGYGVRNVLIYGAGESGRRVFSALVRSPRLGLNPVALVDDDATLEGQDAFVMPSLHEGLGIAALEAVAAGVPLVCTQTDGLAAVFCVLLLGWMAWFAGDLVFGHEAVRFLLRNASHLPRSYVRQLRAQAHRCRKALATGERDASSAAEAAI